MGPAEGSTHIDICKYAGDEHQHRVLAFLDKALRVNSGHRGKFIV